jgi:hypothetical protein
LKNTSGHQRAPKSARSPRGNSMMAERMVIVAKATSQPVSTV